MFNKYYGECTTYSIADIQCVNFCDQDLIDTDSHKSRHHCKFDSCIIQINSNGGSIEIFYTMVSYKPKVIHVEDYKLNLLPIINNIHAYTRVEKNVTMVLLIFFHMTVDWE